MGMGMGMCEHVCVHIRCSNNLKLLIKMSSALKCIEESSSQMCTSPQSKGQGGVKVQKN